MFHLKPSEQNIHEEKDQHSHLFFGMMPPRRILPRRCESPRRLQLWQLPIFFSKAPAAAAPFTSVVKNNSGIGCLFLWVHTQFDR